MSEYGDYSSEPSQEDSGVWLSAFSLRMLTVGLVLLSAVFFILGMLIGKWQSSSMATQPPTQQARQDANSPSESAREATHSSEAGEGLGSQVSPRPYGDFWEQLNDPQEEPDPAPVDRPDAPGNTGLGNGRTYAAPSLSEQPQASTAPVVSGDQPSLPVETAEVPDPERHREDTALPWDQPGQEPGTSVTPGDAAWTAAKTEQEQSATQMAPLEDIEGRYAVQVFASKGERAEAERFVRQHADMEFLIDGPDEGVFRVYAGVFKERASAAEKQTALRQREGFEDCWIRDLGR